MALEGPVGPALDHDETALAVRRYRSRGLALLIAGIALFALVPLGASIQSNEVDPASRHTLGGWVLAVGLLGGALLTGTGVVALDRAVKWRRTLSVSDWRVRRCEYKEVRVWRSVQPVLRIADAKPGDPEVVGIGGVFRWRLDALRHADPPSVWLAGEGTQMVLASPGPRQLYPPKYPRSDEEEKRWRLGFESKGETTAGVGQTKLDC